MEILHPLGWKPKNPTYFSRGSVKRESSFDSPLLKIGDKIKVIKPIETKLSRWWKSMCSVFYDPNLQPKLGDEYLVVDYKQSDEIYQGIAILGEYIVKCLNRKFLLFFLN